LCGRSGGGGEGEGEEGEEEVMAEGGEVELHGLSGGRMSSWWFFSCGPGELD